MTSQPLSQPHQHPQPQGSPYYSDPNCQSCKERSKTRFDQANPFPRNEITAFFIASVSKAMSLEKSSNSKSKWEWADIVLGGMVLASLIGLAYTLSRR
jgi:hypothetical protein